MTFHRGTRLQLLLGCALTAMIAVPAHAQTAAASPTTTDTTADAAQQTATSAPVATTGDQEGLQDIVVTATRRETNLQHTPIAISVLSDQALRDRHVQSLYDLADGSVPSLRIATFEARQSALTVGIRGIVPFDQNQTARDSGVGVYIDGVYLGRSQGLNAALFDVQRIEVLRGPQGTLFGRNTEGGALNIVTRAPSGQFDGRVVAGFGNYGSYNGELHLDLPEYHNFSVKLDGLVQHQDPTVTNPLEGQAGWNYYQRYGGRAQVLWHPTEQFSATFAYDYGHDSNTPFYSQLIDYNPQGRVVGVYDTTTNRLVAPGSAPGAATCAACIAPLSPLVYVSGDHRQGAAEIGVPQQPSVDVTHGVSAILHYDITPTIQLRSITAWRGVSTNQWDNSGGAHRTIFAPNAKFSRYSLSDLYQHQFSQEFQAAGHIPHFDFVGGLYYFQEHAQESAATPSSNQWNATGTGYTILSEHVIPPITSGNQGWDYDSRFLQRASVATAHSYAAYVHGTYTPPGLDSLHLTAGGRYTRDSRNGLLYIVQGLPTNFRFRFRNNRFDPTVTLSYDANAGINLYATYSTGYRAGGANDRSQTFNAFGPEINHSYEAGAKLDLLSHRLRIDLAGYIENRSGTQTDFDNVDTNPASPTFNLHTEETRNSPGTSHIRGVELEVTARPTQSLTVGASYTYTYTRVPPTQNPFLGNILYQVYVVYTPANAASGYIDYQVPLSSSGTTLRFHLDANYADPDYSFQNEPVLTDSSFIMNGRIAIADIPMNAAGQRLSVAVWARNLLNEDHIYRRSNANAAILGDYANFNAPRTYGVEASVNF